MSVRCWMSWRPRSAPTEPRRLARACPAHPRLQSWEKTWIAGTSPAMTVGSRLQYLQLRGGAHAQEGEVAADGEEAEAALRREHGAIGVGAVESRHLVRLLRGHDDAVELAFDQRRVRLDLLAVGERDRKIGRADEQHVDPFSAR